MKRISLFITLVISTLYISAQSTAYTDSLKKFHAKYVKEHEIVRGEDKKQMHFFPVNEKYKVVARFEKIDEAPWFNMETSGKDKKLHRVYGILHFKINDTMVKLSVYQSKDLMDVKQYANYLFAPFTDLTSGEESYDNGRYLDMTIEDLESAQYVIDFNKAYNPYCAYVSNQFNCPIPPKENDLRVAIRAGEMKFGKEH